MPRRRKPRKSRLIAPATVFFTQAKNDQNKMQLAVFAECRYGGARVGPVWGHSQAAVGRCLAELTAHCSCGRACHKRRYAEGTPVRAQKA